MNVTDHAREVALLRVLHLHHIAQPNDRVLVTTLESTWKREIGLRRNDLLQAIDQLLAAGVFAHCTTLAGAALELTVLGAREVANRSPDPHRSAIQRLLLGLYNAVNTPFVLRRVRRRTLIRTRTAIRHLGEDRRDVPTASNAASRATLAGDKPNA